VADSAASSRFEVVVTSRGGLAVLDRAAGEVMHPGVGARIEAEELYVRQSRLADRLAEGGAPLTLFDVGLGAASNALAALGAARAAPPGSRRLEVLSFERDPAALAFAASDGCAGRLGLCAEDVRAVRQLLASGCHEEPGLRWRLVPGDVLAALPAAPGRADVAFWDPFSPRQNPELWSMGAFAALRARCGPRAAVFTYSTATAVRSALLLAGFYAGAGDPSGAKAATTAAATEPSLLARPLDRRWLERLGRSSAPFPPDAPSDALDRIRAHPQFR
jgi:queuine tRNA-ribosyltransferase